MDEDAPDSGLPPLVWNAPAWLDKKRRRRPSVGFAQGLLNTFLRQIQALGVATVCQGNAAAVSAHVKKLKSPQLQVDCVFGQQTELATKAVQSCFGLKVDGKLGGSTWRVLMAHADFLSVHVTDASGAPAGGRDFAVILPDGTKRIGKLDQVGKVSIARIPPGTCAFSLV